LLIVELHYEGFLALGSKEPDHPDLAPVLDRHLPFDVRQVVVEGIVDLYHCFVVFFEKLFADCIESCPIR
jgi:hypothetical protein